MTTLAINRRDFFRHMGEVLVVVALDPASGIEERDAVDVKR